MGEPCHPPAPSQQDNGLQHASSPLRRRQGLTLPMCTEHVSTQGACFPNSRAPTFDGHKGLQLTSPTSDVIPYPRFTFKYAVGQCMDMGRQHRVAIAAHSHQVPTSPNIQAMIPTNGIWLAMPAQPCLCATRACDTDQAHIGSLTVVEIVSRRANGTPKANQKALSDYSVVCPCARVPLPF